MNNKIAAFLRAFKPKASRIISWVTTILENGKENIAHRPFAQRGSLFYRRMLHGFHTMLYIAHNKIKYFTIFLHCKIKYLQALKRNRWRVKIIVTYPELPARFHLLYSLSHILGYRMTNKVNPSPDVVINFQDVTLGETDATLTYLASKHNVINYKCNNISKTNVDIVFGKVFGYRITINPLSHKGIAVKKSNNNSTIQGRIISCPIDSMEEECVYQRLISNELNDQITLEYRVPIFKNIVPFIFLKYRYINNRFGNIPPSNTKVEIAEVHEIFSPKEIEMILLFCREIGLDLGELDILRDRDHGRLYIVDANNTPSWPPDAIRREEAEIALQRLALAFETTFAKRSIAPELNGTRRERTQKYTQ